jgi:hypothetical protein
MLSPLYPGFYNFLTMNGQIVRINSIYNIENQIHTIFINKFSPCQALMGGFG